MKKIIGFFSAAALTLAFSVPAQAASQDECAIWICLPGGFATGCGPAKSAMLKRVKKFKPPLPNFASCAAKAPKSPTGERIGANMTFNHGRAAYIPSQRVCTSWRDRGDNGRVCTGTTTTKARYVRGASCHTDRDGYTTPAGCSRTDSYAEVFADKELAGPIFYW